MLLMVMVVVMMFMLLMVMIVVMMVMFLMVMVVVMLMVMTATSAVRAMIMMVFFRSVSACLQLCHHLCFQILGTFNGCQDIFTVQFLPGRCYDGCFFIMLSDKFDTLIQLVLRNLTGTAQNNGSRMGDLIDKEFSKVLNIHLTLGCIYHCNRAVQNHFLFIDHILNRLHNIGKLTYSGRLN